MNQNAISRLESAGYGKPTITTLKRLAAAMDIGLVVHFVPFSMMIDWVSGTPRIDSGLSTNSLAVPTFEMEEKAGTFSAVEQKREQSVLDVRPSIPPPPPGVGGQTVGLLNPTPDYFARITESAHRQLFAYLSGTYGRPKTLQELATGNIDEIEPAAQGQPVQDQEDRYRGLTLMKKPAQTDAANQGSKEAA